MAFRNIPPNGFPAIPDIEDLEGVEKDVSTLKTTTAGLAEDVGDLEEQKANQITIALAFNPESTYEVGDLVYYNGLTYRCTNEHTGEWDADDFAGTTIANELSELRSGLTNVDTITVTNESALIDAHEATAMKWGKMLLVSVFFHVDTGSIAGQTTIFHVNQTVLTQSFTSVVASSKDDFCRIKLDTTGDIIVDDVLNGDKYYSFTIVGLTN